MKVVKHNIHIAVAFAAAMSLSAPQTRAGADWFGYIDNLPKGEFVSLRKGPSAKTKELARIVDAELTILGPCRNARTGQSITLTTDQDLGRQQRLIRQPGWFCAVEHWPNPNPRQKLKGYVYGKFLRIIP